LTRSRLLVIAGLALGAAFLWISLARVDAGELIAAIRAADPSWILPFIASLAAFCWFKAARWSVLLAPIVRSSAKRLVSAVVVGYAGTTLMPMQMGELIRAYMLSKTHRIRMGAALGSIVLERLLDVLVLLVIVAGILHSGARLDSSLGRASLWLLALSLLALAGLTFLVLRPRTARAAWQRLAPAVPRQIHKFLLDQLAVIASGTAAIGRPGIYARILILSVLQWACMLACAWMSLHAVGLQVPVTAAMAVLATTMLAMSLPAGPGYIGTIQFAFLVALAPFGISPDLAVAASLFYHALLCGPLLLAGTLYLAAAGIRWRELRPPD
jgi:uncharacterized protein (TIRG00374 family)